MKKLLFGLLLFLLVTGAVAGYLILGPATSFPAPRYDLYIHTGMNYEELDSTLKKDEVLAHPGVFNWLAKRVSYPANIKAGKYEIKEGMNLLNILKMLRNGRQVPVNLVITKLRTKEDLAGMIGRKFECDSVAFIRFLNNSDSRYKYGHDYGFPEYVHLLLEYYAFPDIQKNGIGGPGFLDTRKNSAGIRPSSDPGYRLYPGVHCGR